MARLRNFDSIETLSLRLRNFETKETVTIQVISSSSLLQLQEILLNSLPPDPHYASPLSLRFSIDGKGFLSKQETLNSLRASSGDLLYFSFNPNTFSSWHSSETLYLWDETPAFQQPGLNKARTRVSQVTQGIKFIDTNTFAVMVSAWKHLGDSNSNNNNRSSHKLFAVALHAILLDSGFVLIDPVSGLQIDCLHLPDEWLSPFSICYSLPQLFRVDDDSGPRFTDHIVLKFQTLTHFFQVYGSLAKGGSGLYRLSLDGYGFASTLDSLRPYYLKSDYNDGSINSYLEIGGLKFWKITSIKDDIMTDYNDGSINLVPKSEVLKIWKIVKDELALPLLIDLSHTNGLSLPACWMSLPPDLKLRIVESLPATDIARMACVCSEMRILTSNNDLWKRKVADIFGDRLVNWLGAWRRWKRVFHTCWESKKNSTSKKQKRRWQASPITSLTRDEIYGGLYIRYGDCVRYLSFADDA